MGIRLAASGGSVSTIAGPPTIDGHSVDIDPSRPVPLYFQVKTLILEQISSGTYLPGDRLPTEQQFCDAFRISRTPVHRAAA